MKDKHDNATMEITYVNADTPDTTPEPNLTAQDLNTYEIRVLATLNNPQKESSP